MVVGWTSIRPALRPCAALLGARLGLSFGFHSTSTSLNQHVTTTATRWVVRDVKPSAPRESPTPLIFLRTPGLSYADARASANASAGAAKSEEDDKWMVWADMFSQRGWTTVEIDVSVAVPLDSAPSVSSSLSSGSDSASGSGSDSDSAAPPQENISGAVKQAASALNSQLRLLSIPFAPVIVAAGPACLVAQAYVSDYPASGMVLVRPPPDADPREGEKAFAWPKFSYEPRFPILLVAPEAQEGEVRASRVGREAGDSPRGRGVSFMSERDGEKGEATRMQVERWLDMCGY